MSSADEPGERRGLLPRFTLKDGDTFLLADALGDIQAADDGLFTNDTRMLSRFDLFVAGRRPSLLGAAINRDNTLFTAHLTNRPLTAPGELALPKGVIHIERSRLLWQGRWYEQLTLTNFGDRDAEVPLLFCYAADFADIFEVQGTVRKSRGEVLPARTANQTVQLSYRGLDDVVRTTYIEFSQAPVAISATQAEFKLQLRRGSSAELSIEIGARDEGAPARSRFAAAVSEVSADMQERLDQGAIGQHLGPTVRPMDRPLAFRPGAVDDITADRTVSIRGHSVVRHAIRARRNHHRVANAVAQSAARCRRAEVSGIDASDGGFRVSRFAARQDHARDEAR